MLTFTTQDGSLLYTKLHNVRNHLVNCNIVNCKYLPGQNIPFEHKQKQFFFFSTVSACLSINNIQLPLNWGQFKKKFDDYVLS